MPVRTRPRPSAPTRGATTPRRVTLAALALAALATVLPTAADAHGFSTTVYVEVTPPWRRGSAAG